METFLPLTTTLGFTYYDSSSDDDPTFFEGLTFLTGFFGCYYSDYSSDEETFFTGCFATCLAFLTSFFEGATIGTLSYSSLDSTTGFLTTAAFFATGFLGASSEDDSSDDESGLTAFFG